MSRNVHSTSIASCSRRTTSLLSSRGMCRYGCWRSDVTVREVPEPSAAARAMPDTDSRGGAPPSLAEVCYEALLALRSRGTAPEVDGAGEVAAQRRIVIHRHGDRVDRERRARPRRLEIARIERRPREIVHDDPFGGGAPSPGQGRPARRIDGQQHLVRVRQDARYPFLAVGSKTNISAELGLPAVSKCWPPKS